MPAPSKRTGPAPVGSDEESNWTQSRSRAGLARSINLTDPRNCAEAESGNDGGIGEREGLKQLKREIALERYDVDSEAVAGAILRKLELIRRGRSALGGSVADRSRAPRTSHHRAA